MFQQVWKIGLVAVLAVVAACAPQPQAAQEIVGRWQRVSASGPGDPNELSSEYVEFWADGTLLAVAKEETPTETKFWLINSAAYTVKSEDQIEVSGTCWRGWERYTCAKTFQLMLAAGRLTLIGEFTGEYERIGDVSPTLPPTLAPPFATPAPW
ncbi:MAG: hypothetical protein JNL09_06515 [Anaerolineales bacterium]|nr:hypothetical protein [Anaerolineales bacterium]